MKALTISDLKEFQEAIQKDYGLTLEETELHDAAFNLLQYIETLIQFDKDNKKPEGSKVV